MKSKYALFAAVALAILTPIASFAASFGTQNFFYAPSNVITPIPGFTTSWTSSPITSTNPLTASYFAATSTATTTIPNFEGILYADQFSGSDIGAKKGHASIMNQTSKIIRLFHIPMVLRYATAAGITEKNPMPAQQTR